MQTYEIHVAGARDRVHELRRELFAFPEILDVFVTSRPNSLVVVCTGRPRPGEWLRGLRALGYEVLARRHPTAAPVEVDRIRVVAPPHIVPACTPAAAPPRRAGHDQRVKKLIATDSIAGYGP